ncbi:MAG: oligosaccharide flippase family protein [Chloroflexi bacterium]|nr:oligosaccharide flippase family protein [Chloroflexota bacterium]
MNLAQRSIRASAYNISGSLIQTGVAFARSVILLRLLNPDVFGVYRFTSSFIFWTAALPNFGMGGALVHHTHESEGEGALRIHFTLTLLFNIVWVVGLGGLGLLFIQDVQSKGVFMALLMSQFFVNLTQTARSSLVRKVAFRRIALLNTFATILAAVVVVFLAWKGYGVWSLVSSDLVRAGVLVMGLYIIRPVWRPRLGWAKESIQYFLSFGRRNFLNQPLLRSLDRLDDLWTGFFLGDEALGFYSRAYRLSSYPGNVFAAPLGSVASGTYAELKGHPKRLSQAFFRVNAFLIRIGFLLGGLLMLIAPEFIFIVAGEKWLPMVNTFRLMLIFTLLNPLKLTIAGLFTAVGKPEIVMKTRVVQLGVLVSALFAFGLPWGNEGVALAVDLMLLVGIVLLLWWAREYVRISIRSLFQAPLLSLIASMGVVWMVFFIDLGWPMWGIGMGKVLLFSVIYISVLYGFERGEILNLLPLVRKLTQSVFIVR